MFISVYILCIIAKSSHVSLFLMFHIKTCVLGALKYRLADTVQITTDSYDRK